MAAADHPSLLDDAGFLAELEQTDRLPSSGPAPIADDHLAAIDGASRRPANPATSTFNDAARLRAHAALERALEPEYDQQHHHSHSQARERSHGQIPQVLAVLVMVLGFIAGAGVAGLMFHDRVTLVVVERIHIR